MASKTKKPVKSAPKASAVRAKKPQAKKVPAGKPAGKQKPRVAKKPSKAAAPKAKKIARKKEGMSPKIFNPQKLEVFMEKGSQRGFVTFAEIMSFFPEVEKDIDGLDELYQILEAKGIEVKEAREFLEVGEKVAKRRLESKIDPVQMYLKEIGRIPALTPMTKRSWRKKLKPATPRPASGSLNQI